MPTAQQKLDYQRRLLIKKLLRESPYITEDEATKIANWSLCNGGEQRLKNALKHNKQQTTKKTGHRRPNG